VLQPKHQRRATLLSKSLQRTPPSPALLSSRGQVVLRDWRQRANQKTVRQPWRRAVHGPRRLAHSNHTTKATGPAHVGRCHCAAVHPPSPVSAPKCGSWSGTRSVASECAKVVQDYLAERPNLPPRLKPRLPSSVDQVLLVVESKKVAPFLSELGDTGRVALRLQAPTLATCPPGPRPTNPSALCATSSRSPPCTCSVTAAGCPPTLSQNVRVSRRHGPLRSPLPVSGRSSRAWPRPRLVNGRPRLPGRGGRTRRRLVYFVLQAESRLLQQPGCPYRPGVT
jgi:hypothetical protein